jgi:Transcriptional regulatory protein, C terminal
MNTHLHIATQDAEVSATLMRLCARLHIPASVASPEHAASAQLREVAGAFMLDMGEGTESAQRFELPMRLHSLRHALQQVWHRLQQQQEALLPLGEALQLDTARRHIVQKITGEILCELTEKETELLAHLKRAGGAGKDKDVLLRDLWGYHPDAETRTVDSHLYRLRQKLAELPIPIEIISHQGRYILKL